MTASLFQYYTQSLITANLKGKDINLPVVTYGRKNKYYLFFQLSNFQFELDACFM